MTTTTSATEAEAGTTPVYKAAITSLQSRGFRYLYLLDFVALIGSMTIVMLIRFGTGWPDTTIARHLLGFLAATAIFMIVFYFGGLYDRELRVGKKIPVPKLFGGAMFVHLAQHADGAKTVLWEVGQEMLLGPRLLAQIAVVRLHGLGNIDLQLRLGLSRRRGEGR